MNLPTANRNQLIGVLILLVLALSVSVWGTSYAHDCIADPYYVQIWLPIILASAIGALSMHINHMPSKPIQPVKVVLDDSFGDDDAY